MAGQLPKTCDCDGAWMDLAPGYHTFARRFAQHAYHAVCSGKLHHLGPDQMQGWSRRLAPDATVYDKYCEGLIREDYLAYRQAVLSEKKSNEDYVKEARPDFGSHQRFDLRATEDAEHFVASYFGGRAERRRPVLLKLSLIQPHYPFFTDRERFDDYYERVPVFMDESCDHPVLSLSQIEEPVDLTEDEIRRATAAYYGMVDTVDACYGCLLDALRAAGEDLDEWIIIYLSDHGEMLGQHGIWEKARFYEASVRVPLIIRWPERLPGGRVVTKNVSLCDLFATLCDLAGIPCQPGLDSRSLVPLLGGNASNWSNEVVSQIRRRHRDHVMIKQDHLKYQYYGEDVPEVLFDLSSDPGEIYNVIGDPKYASALRSLRSRLADLGYGPDTVCAYRGASYDPGIPVSVADVGALWAPDSNPWLDPLR